MIERSTQLLCHAGSLLVSHKEPQNSGALHNKVTTNEHNQPVEKEFVAEEPKLEDNNDVQRQEVVVGEKGSFEAKVRLFSKFL